MIGIRCACGSEAVYMLTCNSFHGTGHEWALAKVCGACRDVRWFETGRLDCRGVEIHTIPVPLGWSVEQAWEAIKRGEQVPDLAPRWANVEVRSGEMVRWL